MTKTQAVKPKIVDGVHVNFEECKQVFRAFVNKHGRSPMGWYAWHKAYTNDRKDGKQWKLWILSLGFNKQVLAMFKACFPFISLAGCSARAWTHKSDFDRRAY